MTVGKVCPLYIESGRLGEGDSNSDEGGILPFMK